MRAKVDDDWRWIAPKTQGRGDITIISLRNTSESKDMVLFMASKLGNESF